MTIEYQKENCEMVLPLQVKVLKMNVLLFVKTALKEFVKSKTNQYKDKMMLKHSTFRCVLLASFLKLLLLPLPTFQG